MSNSASSVSAAINRPVTDRCEYVVTAEAFYAAILASHVAHQERANPRQAAQLAFDHADEFYNELTRRVQRHFP